MAFVNSGEAAATRLFLTHGADVNAKNKWGRTALHEATRLGHDEIVVVLVSAKDIKIDQTTDEGKTALHVAAEAGAPEIVRILLRNGANHSLKTPAGKTALELAEAKGYGSTVQAFKPAAQQ